jgi:Flp pilus assembly protein TadD
MFGCLAILYQFQRALGPELLAVTSVGGPGSPLAAACLALGFYFFHAVIPVGLTVVYPKWSTGWPPFSQAVSFLVLAAILAWSWVRRRSWGRGPLCALGYFVAMLTPVMGFVKMAYFLHSPVADHFEYLAAIGVVALGAGAGACWAGRNARARPLLVVCAELAVGALFAGSWSHEADFRNEETLWQQTMARNPNAWAAYAGLGVASYDRGAYAQAATCLARACELEPENPLVRNDLGSALAALGRRDEAVVQYTKAMKLCENPVIRYNLVQTLLDLGRYDEALEQGRLAVRQYPKNASMHNLLAEACLKMARPGEAVSEARKALELDPSLSRARKTLAEGLKD